MLTKKNRVWAIAALLGGVIGFSACLKQKDYGPPRIPYTAAIINAAWNPSSLDIFKNGSKMNSNPYQMSASSPFQDYSGKYTFSFRTTKGIGLDSVSRQFDSTKFYTMIGYNDLSGAFAVRYQQEDFSQLSNAKVNVRFLNLSTNVGAVDLYINKKKVASSVTFSPVNDWLSLAPYNNMVDYHVTFAGKDSIIAKGTSRVSSSDTEVMFNTGYAYTIYLSGRKDSTGDNKLKLYYLSHTSGY
ncbi:DUF4397 domain-containing protein [Chitinophaga solisilvae]|uniref:DUF4397 domain-containing protein n=1 Tax=Chitinophaga solisilvae TaxID=1233460 RepID=A0A3S1BK60_9BACT|nr:DUF4397 domain-containing protein [Chitinophaga solisilvae]NSL91069.1 DUF4397 domain-containing protein [Chitinophaga solisilvae]